MGKVGMNELLIILIIVLLLFGPRSLPKLGRYCGKVFGKAKKAIKKNWKESA